MGGGRRLHKPQQEMSGGLEDTVAAEMKDELHRQGEGRVWVQSRRNHGAEQAPGWAEPQLGLVQWLIWPVGGWRQHLPR